MSAPAWTPAATAIETAAAIRSRAVSVREVADATLAAVERVNGALNAVCHLDAGAARADAAAMDERLATLPDGEHELPPFFGVPIGIKDLDSVVGWPTCSGSAAVDHPIASRDSPAVGVLRAAGFLLACSTTSPEFGSVSVTESLRHGATRNPWDLDVSPGGSSGGSAALVAAGALPLAHGSDGAGSIREPASHSGLVGLKPSWARVPGGVVGGLLSEGVLTRTVADTAAVLDVWTHSSGHGWYPAPPPALPYRETLDRPSAPLRIGVSLDPALPTTVYPSAQAVVDQCAGLLVELGHDVRPVAIPGLDPEWLRTRFEVLWSVGTAGVRFTHPELLEPLNRTLHAMAQRTDSLTYFETIAELQTRSAVMRRAWDDVDVLLTPTNPGPAYRIGELWAGQNDDPLLPLRRAEATAAFTMTANLLGLPAISLPLYGQPDGMPLGVQLIGRPWEDDTVLRLGHQLELARPWRDRTPPLWAGGDRPQNAAVATSEPS